MLLTLLPQAFLPSQLSLIVLYSSIQALLIMVRHLFVAVSIGLAGLVHAQCPFADPSRLQRRAEGDSRAHLADFELDDSEGYLTSDVGGPFSDQESLRAGDRGPTLLEDFIFRQKITHFDHERVRHIPLCVELFN